MMTMHYIFKRIIAKYVIFVFISNVVDKKFNLVSINSDDRFYYRLIQYHLWYPTSCYDLEICVVHYNVVFVYALITLTRRPLTCMREQLQIKLQYFILIINITG